MSQQERREVRTTARQISRRKQITRSLLIMLILLITLMLVSYGLVSFVNRAGRFTINIDPESNESYGLSISSTKDFKDPTIMLQGIAVDNMWNITKEFIVNDPNNQKYKNFQDYYVKTDPTYKTFNDIDNVDGSHNGKNYIAYTFYLKNMGKKDSGYYGSLDIGSVAKGADEAIRVVVFRNGEPVEYGKAPKNPKAKDARFGIEKEFVSKDKVMEVTNKEFKVGNVDKYTVVLWLEGYDPECKNDIMGGEVKLSMNFKVLEKTGTTELV